MQMIRYLAVAAAWLVIAVLMATQWYMIDLSYDNGKPWPDYLGPAIIANLLWAALTPVIVLLSRHIPFERRRIPRFFAWHAGLGLVIAVFHTLIDVALLRLLFAARITPDENAVLLFRKMTTSIQVNLLIYGIIVAICVGGRALRNLHERELDASRFATRLAEAETAVLRAQLQPHFLFNALNATSALVRSDPIGAERMIARLGDLLRLAIGADRGPECTLAQELDFMEAYLAIESARLGERLTVVRQISPDALGAAVPALLLQPLAENAVRHGIAPLARGGTLRISAQIIDGNIHIIVADDGVGAEAIRDGMGLGNTRQRLERLYGHRQSLDIATAPGAGFRVSIMVPA